MKYLDSKRGSDRDGRDRGLVSVGTRCGGLQLDANFLNSFEVEVAFIIHDILSDQN